MVLLPVRLEMTESINKERKYEMVRDAKKELMLISTCLSIITNKSTNIDGRSTKSPPMVQGWSTVGPPMPVST